MQAASCERTAIENPRAAAEAPAVRQDSALVAFLAAVKETAAVPHVAEVLPEAVVGGSAHGPEHAARREESADQPSDAKKRVAARSAHEPPEVEDDTPHASAKRIGDRSAAKVNGGQSVNSTKG